MTFASISRLLLDGARITGDLGPQPVLIESGRVAAIGAEATRRDRELPAPRLDLSGYVLLPAAAEPHAHLDKALLADRTTNPAGDLLGAIAATRAAYATMTTDDVLRRARRALCIAVTRGFTAVRTHVSCEEGIGLEAVRALVALRDASRQTVDLQVIAMAGFPLTGREGSENRRILDAALDAGADGVGGAPALDNRPHEAVATLVRVAAERALVVDLHLDETTDPHSLTVCRFVDEVERHELAGRATASHCVSLGQLEPHAAATIAKRLATAGIAVVTLPQTNLYLQGRDAQTCVPRALTAVSALRRTGVPVAAGGDNWRDPFNPVARIDPFETASLLVSAAHLTLPDAYEAVSSVARRVMGLPPVGLSPGAVADLLAVRAVDLADAVSHAGEDRVVLRRGRVVARTRVTSELAPEI